MSELSKSQPPSIMESLMESVTLLPTGVGFLEACKVWLYTGARNKKSKRKKQEKDSIHF